MHTGLLGKLRTYIRPFNRVREKSWYVEKLADKSHENMLYLVTLVTLEQ